ncbi:mitogen-activated protein kinase 15 [Spatholobus suberectus]|nr:mitogen-activated protein kinase 15 [Spatholobus suberectus]
MNVQIESIEEMKWWTKVIKSVTKWWTEVIKSVRNWLELEKKDEWLKEMRGMLSLVATVIATMTFQSAINPPGGVRPADENGFLKCNQTATNPCPGEAVLAIVKKDIYTRFLYCNTICFVSSSAVCLLLVSGLPLDNRFITWLFSIGMCITLTSLTLTYLFGARLVTPNDLWDPLISMFGLVIFIWMILLGLIALCLCLKLIVWIVTKYWRRKRRDST